MPKLALTHMKRITVQYTVYSIQYIYVAGEDCGAAHGGQRGEPQAAPDPRQQEANGRQGGTCQLILMLYVIIEFFFFFGGGFLTFNLFRFQRAITEG
jgi:hypothetical protein